MARSEARIFTSIWAEADFRARTPDAQRIYLYLISQVDLAHDGVIALRERRWARDAAGLTPAQVHAALDELAQARFVVVDEDTEELLIRSFIRRDKVYRQPNVLRAAADHLALVASPVIRAAIAAELIRVQDEPMPAGSKPIIDEMLDALGEGSPYTSGNPSAEGSLDPSANPSAAPPGERGVVTEVSTGFPVPRNPDSPPPETTPVASLPSSSARSRAKRGTRIPGDFAVTDAMVAWARERVPDVDGRHETEKFVNYWRAKTGKDATKLDWAATWRNWMLNAAERGTSGGARASPAGGQREHNGLRLNERTIADIERGKRLAALDEADARTAIEGPP